MQEFRVKLLERLAKFDPTRADFHVFVVTVIERFAASLLKHARAQKRDRHRASSMNAPFREHADDVGELGDLIARDGRRDSGSRNELELVDLALDVAAATWKPTSAPPGPLRGLEALADV